MRASKLAAFAALAGAAVPGQAQTPDPAPVSDEQSYQEAMECKVRVEALDAVSRDSQDRKRLGSALAYWVEKERAAGAMLGKNAGAMLADETIFGFAESSNPESFRRAMACAEQASADSADR